MKAKKLKAKVQKLIDEKTKTKHFGGDIMSPHVEALIEIVAPYLKENSANKGDV